MDETKIQGQGAAIRTVYVGYKPFIPISQQYRMQISPTNPPKVGAGAFSWQPKDFATSKRPKGIGKEGPEWTRTGTSTRAPGRIQRYDLVRKSFEQGDTKDALSKATAMRGDAGVRAANIAGELENVIGNMSPTPGTEPEIRKDSKGEVRTQAYVQNLINMQDDNTLNSALADELAGAARIQASFDGVRGMDESFGGFSSKGFDIGNTDLKDVQTLAYVLKRLRDGYGVDISLIAGAEETNIGGKKLFQTATKLIDSTHATAKADIDTQINDIMGKVESFIQQMYSSQETNMKEIVKLAKTIEVPEGGGNQFVLDAALSYGASTTDNAVWQRIVDAYKVSSDKGGLPEHENIISFAGQVVDRMMQSYNTNLARGFTHEQAAGMEKGQGYFYILPITYGKGKTGGTMQVGVHIYGDFQKTVGGQVVLSDIKHEVVNMGVFATATAAMLDNWFHMDAKNKLGVASAELASIQQRYMRYAGAELQLFGGMSESIGSQILWQTSLNTLGWGMSEFNKVNITFTSTMTTEEMAKSLGEQIRKAADDSSGRFVEMYNKMLAASMDLTKSWKKHAGADGRDVDFTKYWATAKQANSVKALSLLNEKIQAGEGGNWDAADGAPGVWGPSKDWEKGQMEGYSFTPFIDSTKSSTFYSHSKSAIFRAARGEKALKRFVENRLRWEEQKDKKFEKDSPHLWGEILGNKDLSEDIMKFGPEDMAGMGGQSKAPLLRILWQKGDLRQRFVDRTGTKKDFWEAEGATQRDQLVTEYMEILDDLGRTDSDLSQQAKRIRRELKDLYNL
jgi:hypothetical protein